MKKKLPTVIMICLLLTMVFFMITLSQEVIESVGFSISIWKDNLFPTLFPFFVVSNLLMNYGFVDMMGVVFRYPMQKYFHLPGECGFVLAASLFSGFPSGAKYTSDLVQKKIITTQQAERLLTFTHYSNPLFILGMIGNVLLHHKVVGVFILIAHVVSGLLVGFLWNYRYFSTFSISHDKQEHQSQKTFGEYLTTSIFDSLNTMFLLLGIVTMFLIVTTIINHIFTLPPLFQVFLSGILEMTQGVKLASSLCYPEIIKVLLMTGIISFGGFSVHAQVLSIISSQKIKYKSFLLARIFHALLAVIFVFIFYIIYDCL